jgi:hypothetical protein
MVVDFFRHVSLSYTNAISSMGIWGWRCALGFPLIQTTGQVSWRIRQAVADRLWTRHLYQAVARSVLGGRGQFCVGGLFLF